MKAFERLFTVDVRFIRFADHIAGADFLISCSGFVESTSCPRIIS
jgi:hypothetical protein